MLKIYSVILLMFWLLVFYIRQPLENDVYRSRFTTYVHCEENAIDWLHHDRDYSLRVFRVHPIIERTYDRITKRYRVKRGYYVALRYGRYGAGFIRPEFRDLCNVNHLWYTNSYRYYHSGSY